MMTSHFNRTDANKPQPAPTQGQVDVTNEVIKDLADRAEFGERKYGTRLQTHNGRRGIEDAYQEALDLCCYLKQIILEYEGIKT